MVGGEYNVYVGGDVNGEEIAGVYDPESVDGFSEEARQQCYSGTGTFGGFGMGGQRPDGGRQDGGRPDLQGATGRPDMTPPEGFDPETMTPPEGFDPEMMTPPDDFDPESMTPPEGFDAFGGRHGGRLDGFGDRDGQMQPGGFDGAGMAAPDGGMTTVFLMSGRVNGFSGVSDAAETE